MPNIEDEFKGIVRTNRPKKCLGAEFLPSITCDKLINAHSIQKNGILDFVAGSSQTLLHRRLEFSESRETRLVYFEGIGKSAATTFGNGMCGNHDKALFKCIEDVPFQINDKKQSLTFAIRSLLKEIYTKEHITGISNTVFNGNKPNPFSIGYNQANNVLAKAKSNLRKAYIQEKRGYKDFETRVFVFDARYKIACSSVISPWFGFNGEEISSVGVESKKQPILYVNIFPDKEKTYVLLGTHKSDSLPFKKFFKYLKSLDTNALKKAISVILICYCQNMVITDSILSDQDLIEKINRITEETNLQFTNNPQDIKNPSYLKEIFERGITLFSSLTASV